VKLAHILPWISRRAGGLYHSVSGLARAEATADGMQLEVFGSRDEFTDEDVRQWRPLTVHTARVVGPKRLCFTPGLRKMVEGFAPDLIHSAAVWTWQAAMVNRLHARRKVPFVLSTRGCLDGWALGRSVWKKAIALRLYQQKHFVQAACIHALNESELMSIRRFGLRNPVCVIPNGIEMPEGNLQSAICSPQFGGRKVLLYLGRIHPKKGLINLIRAWSATRETMPRESGDWVLVIAGWDEGGHERELQELTQQAGAQGSVLFIGPKFGEEKAALYRSCDAFILPSFSEGLPMAVLEAWAHGKPVLMTPECNLPEGFAAGAAIRIEQGEDGHGIEVGLQELVQASTSELQAMGAKGIVVVTKRFSWPRIAQQMKSVYEWVLGGGTAPSCVCGA